MKNFLNCHSIGLHSFPVSFDNDLYRRIFYADVNHRMWNPFEVAVHPHHVDIKITVLKGSLYNPLFKINDSGEQFKKYQWNSHILNGKGGFDYLGEEKLIQLSNLKHKEGDVINMKACELHTVQIDKGEVCVWLVEESIPTCDYFPVNYSIYDLSKWKPDGLYVEVDDSIKQHFIGEYLPLSP